MLDSTIFRCELSWTHSEDTVFGNYVTTELRSISDKKTNVVLTNKIQNVIFQPQMETISGNQSFTHLQMLQQVTPDSQLDSDGHVALCELHSFSVVCNP